MTYADIRTHTHARAKIVLEVLPSVSPTRPNAFLPLLFAEDSPNSYSVRQLTVQEFI